MSDTRYTALTPPLSDAEYRTLKASILEHGRVLVEVIHDEHGVTIDGFHREHAVAELRAEGHKIPSPEVRVLVGLTEERKRTIARQVNIARRHLSTEQKQRMIEDQLRETPADSNNQIAKTLGVDDKTVGVARQRLVQRGEIDPQERTVGADGKSYPATRPAKSRLPLCAVCGFETIPEDTVVICGDTVEHVGCNRRKTETEACAPNEDAHDADAPVLTCKAADLAAPDVAPAPAPAAPQATPDFPPPTPAAPPAPLNLIRVDNARQAEKLRELAEAGRLDAVKDKGINAAHKQLREYRRHDEIRAEAATEAAQQSDRFRVANEDACAFLDSLPTGCADVIWTDPPYYIAGHGGGTKVGDSYATFDAGGEGWDDAQWATEDEYLEWMQLFIIRCARVLKSTGNLVICADRVLISYFWAMCGLPEDHPYGLKPRNILAWHKTNAAPNARGNYDSALELAVWAVGGPQHTFRRPATGQCSNVWSGPFVSGPTRARWPHPTAKPVEWIQSHLEVLSAPGQLVIDPFGGSGATVEAALRLGRRVIANDRDKKFADMCAARGAYVVEAEKRGWEEALPCAGCRQPIDEEDEVVHTGEGFMHAYPCASTWREREDAVGECDLCGKQHNANNGVLCGYGNCCRECHDRASGARMKRITALDVLCPTCNAVAGRRCKAGRAAVDTHDARAETARKRQQAQFASLGLQVTA